MAFRLTHQRFFETRTTPMAEFHSLVVPMTVINTLLLAVAQEDQEQVMTNLDKLDQLRERFKKITGSTI